MHKLTLMFSFALSCLASAASAVVAFLAALVPSFGSFDPRMLNPTPRSVFETRRMGLC